ncbi:DUF397 domain-containing protein [Streptomyces sp. RLB1-33]|uniref:DUF397 domain-containing protein n=1 Tax=Streptomyces mirabilis TaxID=68239 RepID=UPI00143EEC69|nr:MULTISPECIES: DUF397 domain-containing protein [Streptomyces]QIY71202.1 DUF397 domain-containing protein [Streptomyces sp. RLB1-33]QUW81857.1 DUF397 domain-containing protein [Streptomyces mirabilis]
MADQIIPNAATLQGWRKSSYSNSEGGSCLEVVDRYAGGIPVRDSKMAHGPALVFSAVDWSAFVTAVKSGTFPS